MSKSMRLILAEDDELNRELLCDILDRFGYSYIATSDGKSVLELYASEPADVILMDFNMPILSGPEAALQIREISREKASKPVLVALSGEQLAGSYPKDLFDYVLLKPYSSKKLKQILEEIEAGTSNAREPEDIDEEARREVLDKFGSNTEFLCKLIQKFSVSSREHLQVLRQIAETGERCTEESKKAFAFTAHKLKGELSIFNAISSISLVEQLEASCQERDARRCLKLLELLENNIAGILSTFSKCIVESGETFK